MSNRSHLRPGFRPRHFQPRTPSPFTGLPAEIQSYARKLDAAGFEDREVDRAVAYVLHYGLEAMNGGPDNACVVFAEPSCETGWNCLRPEHQVLECVE